MKILFLSSAIRADYQCDMVFHGLRTLYGNAILDCPRIGYMYQDYVELSELYGRGFTLYGLLPEIPLDRTRIKDRIAAKEFDLIIYGSIQRSQDFFDLVVKTYPRERVLFIDGEDQSHLLYNLSRHGIYFKRELYNPNPGVHPIHFAIPTQKIGTLKHLPKIRVRALIDPRDRHTYVYTREQDYYADYAQSLFAFTLRKGGWDTLRTLEIMANKCIPLYLDIEQCPETTLINLPKAEFKEALTFMDRDATYWDTEEGHSQWTSLWRRIHLKFVCRSTTERLAQYVLETQQREAQS